MNNSELQYLINTVFKNLEILNPLEDLWREENSPDEFVIPDSKIFYKWIVDKIMNGKI